MPELPLLQPLPAEWKQTAQEVEEIQAAFREAAVPAPQRRVSQSYTALPADSN